MRVLHVSSDCGHGGVETMLAALIREQRKSGIEADAYFLVDQGGVGHYENLCKVMFAILLLLCLRIISTTLVEINAPLIYCLSNEN